MGKHVQAKEHRTNTFNHYSSSQIFASGNISSYSHETLHVTSELKTSVLPRSTTVTVQLNGTQLLKLEKKKGIREMSLDTRLWFHRWQYVEAPSRLLGPDLNHYFHREQLQDMPQVLRQMGIVLPHHNRKAEASKATISQIIAY